MHRSFFIFVVENNEYVLDKNNTRHYVQFKTIVWSKEQPPVYAGCLTNMLL